MGKYASVIVKQAQSWLGCNEADGSHKKIIDVYNSHKPWARGYKMPYNVAWCSCFVSACAIAVGYTDIIPTEVGCGPHIDLFKKLGILIEDDAYIPSPGDIILYDWEDSGNGDNTGYPNHIGIVEKVLNGIITVIEGNYNDAVKRRAISWNGKYIRGYAVPKYDPEPTDTPEPEQTEPEKTSEGEFTMNMRTLKYGSKGEDVKALQILLIGNGCPCGKWGADGDFGISTENAVKEYQRKKNLQADGIAGPKTWSSLLGVK
jgi:hypothetical protein